MQKSIHQIIKKRRLALGLTLKDVASALNIAESTVSRYESNDIQNMGIDKIHALSKVLQCSPAYLMGWEPIPSQLNSDEVLTSSEKEHLKKYRTLDEKGQHTVSTVLHMEYNRCAKNYLKPIAAHNDNINDEELEKINRDLEKLRAKARKKRNK